jgi:hypothetical protein
MRPNGAKNTILIAHPGDANPVIALRQVVEGPLGNEFSYEDFLEAQYFWAGADSAPGSEVWRA